MSISRCRTGTIQETYLRDLDVVPIPGSQVESSTPVVKNLIDSVDAEVVSSDVFTNMNSLPEEYPDVSSDNPGCCSWLEHRHW